MIVSHKYKYIFTKPRKVASTSLEIALSQHCGPEDIITPNISSNKIDDDSYTDRAQNDVGFFNHIRPSRIKKKIGSKTFNEYTVFTVVRNPWDMLVSRYFWETSGGAPVHKTPSQVLGEIRRKPLNLDLYGKLFNALRWKIGKKDVGPGDSFETFMKKLPLNYSNKKYYFTWFGTPWNDHVIRYEHLAEDYETVCTTIGIPYEPLPHLKTKTRKSRDYREFYTPKTRKWVEKKFKKEIATFGYSFDDYEEWN